MSRYRCVACGGEYVDPQADGTAYYHACPGVVDPAAVRQLAEALKLPEADVVAQYGPGLPTIPGPDHRDERRHPKSARKQPRIVAEGQGRTEVPA